MKNKVIDNLILQLEQSEMVGLISHKDGDGDAFGSQVALKIMLEKMGKKVVIFSAEDLPEEFYQIDSGISYNALSGWSRVDVLVCLDFNNVGRAVLPNILEKARIEGVPILAIDHHRPLDLAEFADIYWGEEEASSVSEMVSKLFKKWGIVLDKAAASFLLFGIETDTNSLQNSNTTEAAYETVSELLKMGARLNKVVLNALKRKSVLSSKLLGIVMQRLHHNKKYNLVTTYITQEDVQRLGLLGDVSSGIANFIDRIKESGNIIVFSETDTGTIKVSMRSNRSNANVAKLAEFFGGGGHIKAAGFSFEGAIKSILGI